MNSSSNSGSGRVLAVLFLGVLMAALDIAMLGPAKPAIQETFGVDERLGSWILNAFVLFNLMGVPISSKLADIYGRRLVFPTVVVLFAIGGLIVAASKSYEMFLVGRCIQGFSASGIFPVAAAVTADTFPPERRGRALGVLGAVFGLAFIIGPVASGMLLQVGWRFIYLAYIPMALVVAPAALYLIPSLKERRNLPIDIPGVVVLMGMILALTYGISQLDPGDLIGSMRQPRIYLSLIIALVSIPLFIRLELSAKDPVIRPALFSNRQIRLAAFFAIGTGMVEAAFISFPTLVGLSMGVSRSVAAYMLLPLSFAIVIGSPGWGRILDKVGSRIVIGANNLLLFLGLALIAVWPSSVGVFYTGTAMIGLGMAGIMGSALNYIMMHEALDSERTAAQGIITLSVSIGQLLGAAYVGAVVASSGGSVSGYTSAFLGVAAIILVLAFAALRLKKRDVEQAGFSRH